MNREFEIFLFSPTTADESAVFSTKLKILLIPLSMSEKSIRIEPLSLKKEQELFSVPSPHYRGNKNRFDEKREKISPPAENPVRRLHENFMVSLIPMINATIIII